MAATPLISAEDLATRLAEPALRIIDCRFELNDVDAGQRAYAQSRIPHARYADLNRDLSDLSQTHVHGRHPLPSMGSLAASFSRMDIGKHSPVVVYDQDTGVFAARLWWLLRSLGNLHVKVLDGGFAAWNRLGLPLETQAAPRHAASRLPEQLSLPASSWVTAEQLRQWLTDHSVLLMDARAGARFRGEIEPLDKVAGHVPGAINRPFMDNLDVDGRFKDPEQLRKEFLTLLGSRSPAAVIHMCGSGVTACHNRLAMDLAGLRGSRIFADSWSGWISDPSRPVATGP